MNQSIRRTFDAVRRFIAAAPGAIEGSLNVDELLRVVASTVVAGGGVQAVIYSITQNQYAIFGRGDAALGSAALVFAYEAWRRFRHQDNSPAVEPLKIYPR